METVQKIISGLRGLGVEANDTLLVHSSLKSLGRVEGGAGTVIEALLKSLPSGTLLLPALSYENVSAAAPRFSVRDTPCCVGKIPETFRRYPGAQRSVHPTHSVCAAGKNAPEMTKDHYKDRTPVGENSPFRKLAACGGKILMLGCGLKPNTFMHGVEEAMAAPYVLNEYTIAFYMENPDGSIEETRHITHNFYGVNQRYDRVIDVMRVRSGKVLEADCYIMEAAVLWEAASKKIKEEPWFFVDKVAVQ